MMRRLVPGPSTSDSFLSASGRGVPSGPPGLCTAPS
jgi:hypothetical protein